MWQHYSVDNFNFFIRKFNLKRKSNLFKLITISEFYFFRYLQYYSKGNIKCYGKTNMQFFADTKYFVSAFPNYLFNNTLKMLALNTPVIFTFI